MRKSCRCLSVEASIRYDWVPSRGTNPAAAEADQQHTEFIPGVGRAHALAGLIDQTGLLQQFPDEGARQS